MTSPEKLNAEQKELVAIGASVGAGCQTSLSHHLKAGAQVGLGGEQLLAAAASAERVSAEAAVAIGDHARAQLDANITSAALLSRLEEALASFGAALGANDPTNIERQLRAAADLGATRSQLEEAIRTAHDVQENAARIHLREAKRLLDEVATTAATPAAPDAQHAQGCGCGSEDKPQETPTTEEPIAAGGRHTAGCGPRVPLFAVGDASAVAGCREMFERFMSAAAPAESDQAPAAATATVGCNKEV